MPKYFVAVIPPSDIFQEIIDFQKEIEQGYGAIHAQKAPPHITVITPFDCEVEKFVKFHDNLIHFLVDKSIFDINLRLDNFQRFESRTLFVDVAKNERFEQFCKELKSFFNQQKIIKQRVEKHYFVPHITLANKDIKKRDFKLLWKEFEEREYQREFTFKELTVLELIDSKWRMTEKVKLN